MKYIDLYSGIGGFRQALDSLGHNCVFSAEIDKNAINVYLENFFDDPEFNMDKLIKMTSDMIDTRIPSHDLLVAGFPCQTFSNAGHKKGFDTNDTRGTQFFNILKIIDVKKPKFLLLENVKHLMNHNSGNTIKIIRNELSNRGYHLSKENLILSPSNFGIPHNRERIFLVGSLANEIEKFVYKKKNIKYIDVIDYGTIQKDFLLSDIIISQLNAWGKFVKGIIFPLDKTLPVIWVDEMRSSEKININFPEWKKKYLRDMRNLYNNNKNFIDEWIIKNNVDSWKKREKKFEWQVGKNERDIKNSIITLRQSGIRCKSKPIYPTLVAMVQVPIIFDYKLDTFRYITIKEASKLQNFKNNFKHSDNVYQAYKQLGNSVNVEVIKNVAKYYFN